MSRCIISLILMKCYVSCRSKKLFQDESLSWVANNMCDSRLIHKKYDYEIANIIFISCILDVFRDFIQNVRSLVFYCLYYLFIF
jgi:hypothetical protein